MTKRQEYALTDGETFTPIVDIAIKMDGDPSLAAEISHFRAYRSEARRCATEMAELRRAFLKARQNARISLAHLAAASAYTRIEPRVLHDLVDTQELPPQSVMMQSRILPTPGRKRQRSSKTAANGVRTRGTTPGSVAT
jgi:hypothetical protein